MFRTTRSNREIVGNTGRTGLYKNTLSRPFTRTYGFSWCLRFWHIRLFNGERQN